MRFFCGVAGFIRRLLGECKIRRNAMKIMDKKVISFAFLVILAAQLSGCAAGWFAGGAATGAVVTHELDENHKK